MAFLEQHIKWGRKSISFNQSVSNDNDILEQNGHHNKTVANSPVSPRLRAKSSTVVSQHNQNNGQVSTKMPISLDRLFAFKEKINRMVNSNENVKPLIAVVMSILIVFILIILFYFQLF